MAGSYSGLEERHGLTSPVSVNRDVTNGLLVLQVSDLTLQPRDTTFLALAMFGYTFGSGHWHLCAPIPLLTLVYPTVSNVVNCPVP